MIPLRLGLIRPTILAALLLFVLASHPGWTADVPAPAGTKIHHTRGVIRNLGADRKTALIRHEAIPGFMPAMTMDLNVKEPRELDGFVVGDRISFRLVSDDQSHWIDTIRRLEPETNVVANPTPTAPAAIARTNANTAAGTSAGAAADTGFPLELKPGDTLPDATFLAETGKPLRFSDYRGRALAFTFIFTRCPLPEFCPLMSRQFARARDLLRADPQSPTNWHFLSLSFDPEFDKPGVLAGYARSYRSGDADRWTFAALPDRVLRELAPRLDLIVAREGDSISHNLRTVVLDPHGTIHRQFDGNRWSPEDLAGAIREAAAAPPKRVGP